MKDNVWKYVSTKYWKIIFCPKFKLHATVRFQRFILDPKCATDVGNLRCPTATTVTQSSSVAIAIASSQTTPAIEESSTRLTLHPSMSATMSASRQSLITKTASPGVMTSCPNICNRTACYEGKSSGKSSFSTTWRCSYDLSSSVFSAPTGVAPCYLQFISSPLRLQIVKWYAQPPTTQDESPDPFVSFALKSAWGSVTAF